MSFIAISNSNEGGSYVRTQAKATFAGSTPRRAQGRGRIGMVFACLIVLCAFLGSSAPASGAVPPKGVTSFFGSNGGGAGQMLFQRGTGVNQSTGNVYIADGGNNRVVVFNASGTFLRAFGQDVVSSGPGNSGTGIEICIPANGDVCKAGTTGATGGALSNPQGLAVDQSTGNVYVTDQNNLRVQQFDANGTFLRAFGQDVVASGPGNAPAASAVQSLNVTATGGKYTLSFGGKTTPELPFNATAAEVQTALTGLTSIGAGNVEVAGASPPYTITFKGALANNPEPTIVAASGVGPGNELEGGAVTVTTTVTGSTGFEVCVAANGDVCKAGTSVSTGGGFKSTFNGHLAVAPSGAPNAGNVLVADPANLRVQEFTSAGAFVRTFGFDVVAAGPGNTGATFEVCAAANGDACKIGVSGTGSGQFSLTVNRVAEDSAGNVYTVESGTPNFRVQKFTLPGNVVTPGGTFSAANLKGTAASSAPFDVAIDPATNNLLVTKGFVAGATPNCPNTGVASVAERRIVEVSSAGVLEGTHIACAGITATLGLGVRGSTGDLYVSSQSPPSTSGVEARIYVLNVVPPPSITLSAISDVGDHEATITGFVNANAASAFPTSYQLEYKRAADSVWSSTVGTEIGTANANIFIEKTLTALDASTTYEVRFTASRTFAAGSATTPVFAFTTSAAAPSITNPVVSTAATETGARIAFYGTVNPNGKPTTYRFEFGTDADYGSSIPLGGASIGSGSSSLTVDDYVEGLEANTTYHYRLVAQSASGLTVSPDQTVTTPPLGGGLPSGRVAELVTPADKRPTGNADNIVFNQLYFQAAESGDAMAYLVLNGVEGSTTGGEVVYAADRAAEGWSPQQVTPAALVPPPLAGVDLFGRSGVVRYFSPDDLKCGMVETHNPLTDDTPAADIENGVYNLYRWNKDDNSYTLISNRIPLNPSASTNTNVFYEVIGATADCSRIFFKSNVYNFLSGSSGIYEWDNGTLREALQRPDGSIATGHPQFEAGDAKNVVSPDGRYFFSATSNQGANAGKAAIFVRKGPGQVIDATQPTHGATMGAKLETVSPDGSKVFFLANYGIAGTSSAGPTNADCTGIDKVSSFPGNLACDLYSYDVETGELKDISADSNLADSNGAVAQGVLAVSDDGSSIYFAARGQLVPGQGRTYSENLAQQAANIYLSRNGSLTYVGGLATTDDFLFSPAFIRNGASWSSQTTANGDYLLFASRDNMTGTNPVGTQQAYLFSSQTGSTICVSCPLDGSQPHTRNLDGGVKRAAIPNQQAGFNKYTPRSLAEDGTVMFESEDALTPGSVEGQSRAVGTIVNRDPLETNVYEWRDGQVSLLVTGQVEPVDVGGPDGRDFFVKTYAQLIPNDFDFSADIYDLRSGGGFPAPPTPPTPCDPAADQCQGTPSTPPVATNPASSQLVGPGNPPVQEPKQKKKKKKHKKKKKNKKKQHSNRHNARAASANTGGAK
ncbi:MAG TPA: hypothetical protein VI039_03620 [Solirubrobacterales bacterium]